MVNSFGKDYATGRQLMTDEINTVVAAIFEFDDAEILVMIVMETCKIFYTFN